MNRHSLSHPKKLKANRLVAGFTVLETLIAGLIVAAVMTSVGRLSMTAMATSSNQSSRNTIEAAINDHLQLIQMQDSYLTPEAIRDPAGLNINLSAACQNPSISYMAFTARACDYAIKLMQDNII